MKNKTQQIAIAFRALGAVALFGLIGSAKADMKLNVTVLGSGAGTLGIPAAGQYVVDFRSGMARVEEPNGAIDLFDFNSATVAFLNPTTKTYTVEPIASLMKPRIGTSLTTSLATDTTASSQTLYGATAVKYSVSTQYNSSGYPTSMSGTANRAHGVAAFLAARQRPNATSQLTSTSGSNATISISGSSWLVSTSVVKANVTSVAPLVILGAPRTIVDSLTSTLNAKEALPLTLSFSWTTTNATSAAVQMSVSAVSTSKLDDALFDLPSGYTRVAKQTS